MGNQMVRLDSMRIEKWMSEHNYGITAFAKAIHKDHNIVGTALKRISKKFAKKISDFTGIPLSELINEEAYMYIPKNSVMVNSKVLEKWMSDNRYDVGMFVEKVKISDTPVTRALGWLPIDKAEKIAEFMGVSLDELIEEIK